MLVQRYIRLRASKTTFDGNTRCCYAAETNINQCIIYALQDWFLNKRFTVLDWVRPPKRQFIGVIDLNLALFAGADLGRTAYWSVDQYVDDALLNWRTSFGYVYPNDLTFSTEKSSLLTMRWRSR